MPKLFWRILITAVAAGLAFLLTSILSEDDGNIWQWTASIVIGSAVLIVQYLVDFSERLEKVDRRFAEIIAATELFSQVDGSVLRSDKVTRLVLGYTKVGEQGGDIVEAFAEKELGRLARLMEGLGSGNADCPGENHEWLIDITDCAKMTIFATSTSVDRDFWSSEPAKRYLAAQEKAIRARGVEVRRLFLVDTEAEITESLRQLCDKQRRSGIDARISTQSQAGPDAPLLNDVIIFDGELCYEMQPDVRGRPAMTKLKMTREHVEERIEDFNALWAAAPEPEVPQRVTSET
ncbi:DUF6879 family protein [Streptomyces cyaneochromogenes]|nr:DUF6879 family protein [Streptomyces cyaneochromogenes]